MNWLEKVSWFSLLLLGRRARHSYGMTPAEIGLVGDHWIEQDSRNASTGNSSAGMEQMIFLCENHDAGEQLAISSHGSVLQLVSISEPIHSASSQVGLQSQQLLSLGQLPLRCIRHLSETKLVGAGFDGEVCSHPDT